MLPTWSLVSALLTCTAWGQSGAPQDAVTALKAMSIDDLMQTKVTSVSRYPEKLIDAAAAIQVLSGEEIRRSGYTTIPNALRLADNLNVAQKNPHDWAISARGFNANLGDKLLVLIDGRTVYSPLFSGVFWNAQDYILEDIDRIEVVSGPGGTLWGANAVNGVINISTKSAADTTGIYADVGFGTEYEGFGAFRYGGKLGGNAYFRVYGKYLAQDDAALAAGGDADDAWHQGQTGFRVDAQPRPDDTFTVQGDFYSGNEHLQGVGVARIAGANLLSHWTRRFSNDSDFSAKVYYDRTHLRDPFGASPFQPAGILIDDVDTYDIDLQHRFRFQETHQVVWGAGFRLINDRVKQQAPNLGFFPAEATQRLYSFFAQDEIKVLAPVFLTVGSKVEHNDYTGWEVEPNVRLRWDLGDSQTLWAAVSRAVRMPSRFDRDLAEPSIPPAVIKGSSDFTSEIVVAEEIGYRASLNKRVSGAVTLFYNDYDDLRGLASTPVTTLPLFYSNSLKAKTYGAEISADFQVTSWWTLHGGYTRLHEDIELKPGKVDVQNGLGETADPKHQWSLRTAFDLPHRFEFDAHLRHVASLLTNNFATPGTVPAYTELNVRLSWRPTRSTELSLIGQNLLHPHHAEFGFPSPTREELQRGVYAKVALRF